MVYRGMHVSNSTGLNLQIFAVRLQWSLVSLEDAFAAPMGRTGSFSDGRDIGVVCNLPARPGPVVLPMAGDVGSQPVERSRNRYR